MERIFPSLFDRLRVSKAQPSTHLRESFQSVRSVDSFDALIASILFCCKGASADHVKLYAKLRGVAIPDQHMAIIVQQQVDVLCSALIQISKEEYFIEAYEGDLAEHIRGCGSPQYVAIHRSGSH